ncbi:MULTISPECIES: hypothetical protein [unclassified Labrenzia]|uniref:hypothetical protein n=1 Tax=unclassified Labrenzia TaxID=2648686 RepID=UPI0004B22F74|nr:MULTISPECIES: hypothetical protein [unclassified Labrenzia]
MSEQALQEMETALGNAVKVANREMPLPNTLPQPVDSALVDSLRNQAATFEEAIQDLDKAIGDLQARRSEYGRALIRCKAALDVQIDTKHLESAH